MSNYNTRTSQLPSRLDVNTRIEMQSSRHRNRGVGLDESQKYATDISTEDYSDILTDIKAEFSDSDVGLEIHPRDVYPSEEEASEAGPDVELTSPSKSGNGAVPKEVGKDASGTSTDGSSALLVDIKIEVSDNDDEPKYYPRDVYLSVEAASESTSHIDLPPSPKRQKDRDIHCLRDYSLVSITTSKPRHNSTKTNSDKKHECEECEFSTNSKHGILAHIRTHTGEKPFKCELCDYRSTISGNLHRHMRKHTGEKPFKCELCDYKTTESRTLRGHMISHTGEKPFICELCDYKTIASSTLRRHLRNHTGEKPFKCKLCDHKTSYSSHLRVHMRKHTGEKPFKCKLCDYRTPASGNLDRHMKTHI